MITLSRNFFRCRVHLETIEVEIENDDSVRMRRESAQRSAYICRGEMDWNENHTENVMT